MGKRVLITGSNRGIGKKLVEQFAQNGFNIVACARKKDDSFDDYLKDIVRMYNIDVTTSYFDMEDEQCIKRELKSVINKVKTVDVLINNAGYGQNALFPMISSNELKKEMQINYISPIIISQIVSRVMIRNGGGSIINIASVSGIRNEQGRLAYGSSKAALIFATKTMSLELAPNNVRVNSVSPGFIDTDMWNNRSEQIYKKVLSETPLGRQGNTKDVADLVYYLASDAASHPILAASSIILFAVATLPL